MKYQNPPILSVLAEVTVSQQIRLTPIEDLYGDLGDDYPGIPIVSGELSETLDDEIDDDVVESVLFRTEDESRRLQITNDRIALRLGLPYTSWNEVQERLNTIVEVIEKRGDDLPITQARLIYENAILVPHGADPASYMTIQARPSLGALSSGFVAIDSTIDDILLETRIMRHARRASGDVMIGLDIEVRVAGETLQLDANNTRSIFERLKGIARDAFESSITDVARGTFNAAQ